MTIATVTEHLKTRGQDDCVDITHDVQEVVTRGKIRQGLATVFVMGSTAGVIPPPIALPKADIR